MNRTRAAQKLLGALQQNRMPVGTLFVMSLGKAAAEIKYCESAKYRLSCLGRVKLGAAK